MSRSVGPMYGFDDQKSSACSGAMGEACVEEPYAEMGEWAYAGGVKLTEGAWGGLKV